MSDKKQSVEWVKLFEVFLALVFIPTFIFYAIGSYFPPFLKFTYYFILFLFVFQASFSYLYSFVGIFRKRFKERPTAQHKPVPKTTFMVSAYLPNELDVVEETLLNILQHVKRPADGIEVFLAYNTPHMEPIELRLRELAFKWPELILANAHGSRSKSENLNYALDMASGEMIVLLDADHIVMPHCLPLAWRWLDEGYSVVQGRCKIRNGKMSLVSALVEVEFEVIYGISHHAKSCLFDSALFGGSNGYWRSSVIKKLKFREDRLTEDIDCTLRAVLSGEQIVHDRAIVSTEFAPLSPAGLWFQRKRWAQGWYQCSVEQQWPVLTSSYLNVFQKFMWTTLLMWRVVFDILGHYLFPVVFAFWMTRGQVELPMNGFIWFALLFTFLSGPFEALIAYRNAAHPKASIIQYFCYAFLAFPYTLFKNSIQVVAMRDEMLGVREWIVSKRGK